MSKPCRLTFFAYMLQGVQRHSRAYEKDDLENGIDYAEGLIAMGYSHEPHDSFDLQGYIDWAKAESKRFITVRLTKEK